jgi:DNA gyrase subunit A
MALRDGDRLVGMAILPGQIVEDVVQAQAEGLVDDDDESTEDNAELPPQSGPWVLVVTTGGLGKRVPVRQFRLQNRAGMGILATKFRKKGDTLAALHIVNEGDEMVIVTNRGIIIRQAVDAISSQSRSATGVRVQRLDEDDAIAAVALVPPTAEEAGVLDEAIVEAE